MKKTKLIFFAIIFLYTGSLSAQEIDLNLYLNIKSFYDILGYTIDKSSTQELESIINVQNLVEKINTPEISLYEFNLSQTYDLPSNIIIVENDSTDIYDIFAINDIISRIIDISIKYPDVSTNKKDILWIKNILALHNSAIGNAASEGWLVERKVGKYTYHIAYKTYKYANEKREKL